MTVTAQLLAAAAAAAVLYLALHALGRRMLSRRTKILAAGAAAAAVFAKVRGAW